MAGLTLDSGALIAAERNDRRFWAYWRKALERNVTLTIPAGVLAQSWRGGRNARMAMVVAGCETDPLDKSLAKRTGELCASTGSADVVDSSLMLGAARRKDDVLTCDADDLKKLAPHTPGVGRIVSL